MPKFDFATTGPGIGTPDDDADDADEEDDDEDAAPEDDDDDDDDDDEMPEDDPFELEEEDEFDDELDEFDQEVSGSVLGSVVTSSRQPAKIVVVARIGNTRVAIRGRMGPLVQGVGVVGS